MSKDRDNLIRALQIHGDLPTEFAKRYADSTLESESLGRDAKIARTPQLLRDTRTNAQRVSSANARVAAAEQEQRVQEMRSTAIARKSRTLESRARQSEAKQASIATDLHYVKARTASAPQVKAQASLLAVQSECFCYILSDMVDLYIDAAGGAEDISAAVLNAGAASSVTREFEVLMVTDTNQSGVGDPSLVTHSWARFPMASGITPGESAVDADISAPTVAGAILDGNSDPLWSGGTLKLVVTFDTDAGATKTYAPGDSLTVQVDVSGLVTILPSVTAVTKQYNVI